MPMQINPETGIPEYHFDIPPEDPANPDVIPLPDESTPPRFDTLEEIEHEGVIALGGPDFDKKQPPAELPSGDPTDNDQPSGDPENDEHVPPGNKHPPTREVPADLPAPEWESPPRGPAPEPA